MNAPPLSTSPGVSLIGVPTDIGAGTLGARMGPDALRVAGIAQAIAVIWVSRCACCGLTPMPTSTQPHSTPGTCGKSVFVAWTRAKNASCMTWACATPWPRPLRALMAIPTYREAQLCMEMVADTGPLASLDLVELNPALDVPTTARWCVSLKVMVPRTS